MHLDVQLARDLMPAVAYEKDVGFLLCESFLFPLPSFRLYCMSVRLHFCVAVVSADPGRQCSIRFIRGLDTCRRRRGDWLPGPGPDIVCGYRATELSWSVRSCLSDPMPNELEVKSVSSWTGAGLRDVRGPWPKLCHKTMRRLTVSSFSRTSWRLGSLVLTFPCHHTHDTAQLLLARTFPRIATTRDTVSAQIVTDHRQLFLVRRCLGSAVVAGSGKSQALARFNDDWCPVHAAQLRRLKIYTDSADSWLRPLYLTVRIQALN